MVQPLWKTVVNVSQLYHTKGEKKIYFKMKSNNNKTKTTGLVGKWSKAQYSKTVIGTLKNKALLWTECFCSLKINMLSPMPNVMLFGSYVLLLQEVIKSGGWSSHKWN